MKKFSIYCGYDILIMGAEEPREVELEINFLKQNKILKFSGIIDSIDSSALNMCHEEEGDDYTNFLERTDTELKRVGDNIEYTFNDGKEGEINFFLSAFLLPRYDKLLVDENGNQTEYIFTYKDIVKENLIHTRVWEIKEST